MSGYELARAAMVDWSERDAGPAGGAALVALVRANAGALTGHVLVAGCTGDDVLAAVRESAREVTVLVRGTDDAEKLAEALAGPAFRVVCGDLGDLPGLLPAPADAAVLLDGLGRITSAESAPDTWPERLAAVRAVLAADAPVLLRIDNPLSAAALGALPGVRAVDGDAAWEAPERTAPATVAAAAAVAPGAVLLAAFGPASRPTLLLPAGTAPGSGAAALALAHTPGTGRPDERATLRTAADAGRLDDHAPAWVLAPAGVDVPDLPAGTLFEEAFLDAAAAHDIGAARALLRAAAGTAGAPTSLVVAADGALHPLPVDGPASEDPFLDLCLALATRVATTGVRHPWPIAADRAELARLFLAATDRDVPAEELAARLPEAPELPADGVAAAEAQTAAVRDRERAFRQMLDEADHRIAHLTGVLAERTELLNQSRANFNRARENVQRLRARQKGGDAARLRAELDAVRASRSYRLGNALTKPVRLFRRSTGE